MAGLTFSNWKLRRHGHDELIVEDKGREKTSRNTLLPEVMNQGLLEVCLACLGGKWCDWSDEEITLDTILLISLKCKEYLSPLRGELNGMEYIQNTELELYRDLNKTLTMRQIHCGALASRLIGQKRFIHAMSEFMDCIDDYRNASRITRAVSINEYALYSCLLEMFISNLEERSLEPISL